MNTSRPTSLTYPDGRLLTFDYGSAGGVNDKLSRVEALINDDSGSTHFVDYSFLGRDRTVIANYPQPGVELTYYTSGGSGDAGDQYTGLDRFGRVTDQRWRKTSDNSDRERVKYGFDRASNRVWRQNTVAGTGQDEFYTYDNLYQIKTLDRGTLTGTPPTGIGGTPSWEEDFNYDPTGNWRGTSTAYLTKVSGTTTLDQNRSHTKANEIDGITRNSGTDWPTPTHDPAGNMTKVPQPSSLGNSYDLKYDAWNRLVEVKATGGSVVATYHYDGQNRRVSKDDGTTVRHFYYSNQWQILEERLGTSLTADRQFFWGMRYIDDLVVRERSSERLYALHDYFNVTAIIDTTGAVQERYGYDAFGASRMMDDAFASRTSSLYEWETRFAAYRWDSESGLYQVRHRYLHPKFGRWVTRDPLVDEKGPKLDVELENLYDAVHNNPANRIDSHGLFPMIPFPIPKRVFVFILRGPFGTTCYYSECLVLIPFAKVLGPPFNPARFAGCMGNARQLWNNGTHQVPPNLLTMRRACKAAQTCHNRFW